MTEETSSLAPEIVPDDATELVLGVAEKKFKWRDIKEKLIYALLFGSVLISVLTTIGIILSLFTETFSFFKEVPI
ncbi:MAG: phosphate ABC transporter permease subunit PstC, partial [Candidatus Aquicultor secundus]